MKRKMACCSHPARAFLVFVFCLAILASPAPPAQAQRDDGHILGLHLVHQETTPETARAAAIPPGYRIAPSDDGSGREYLIEQTAVLTNADFAEVASGFDQYTSAPIISFRLNPDGAQTFARITAANIGRAFAIVIDGKVVSAPVIQAAITGGRGQISGGFSIEQVQDLVSRMTAGMSD